MKVDPINGKIVYGLDFIDKLPRTKFEDWRYEDERRMFVDLKDCSQEGENHFYEFSSNLVLRQVDKLITRSTSVRPQRCGS